MKVINNDDNKLNGSGSNDVNDDKNYGDRCSNYHEAQDDNDDDNSDSNDQTMNDRITLHTRIDSF